MNDDEEEAPRELQEHKETANDDDVGYRKPPRQHQFKPGQSGNPKGKPKGIKSEATMIRELFFKKVRLLENGREHYVTMAEALLRRALQDALRGNLAAMRYLDARYAAALATEPSQAGELSSDEKEVLNEYTTRLLASLKENNDDSQ
jgi:hypothetical protein